MNEILNRGVVCPYIDFRFAAGDLNSGEQIIDTKPPRYFVSFHQERTPQEACQWTLELMFVPDPYNDNSDILTIHNMLLSSINLPVRYRYGYVTPYGGLTMQEQCYCGTFLEYDETLNDGYLTYKITGIAREVEMLNEKYQIQDFLREEKKDVLTLQPSTVVEHLLFGDNNTGLPDFFRNYRRFIDHTDDYIDKNSVNVPDGTMSEILIGTYNKDGAYTPGGFCRLSHITNPTVMVSQGLISAGTASAYIGTMGQLNHGVHGDIATWAVNEVNRVAQIPFVCYFDNVINDLGDSYSGSFHYVAKKNLVQTTPSNQYEYYVGNSRRDSDVLSFNVTLDGVIGKASVPGLKTVEGNIDSAGNYIATNNNVLQSSYFVKNTYNTLSGFNEALLLSRDIVANAFNYPFEATMEVVGQTKCNQLLDVIYVAVYVNNKLHDALTGDYMVMGIEDNLSSSGFTTTLKLVRKINDNTELPPVVTNGNVSNAGNVQKVIDENS